jgi:quercetin dioxygenase-like cupin family protein
MNISTFPFQIFDWTGIKKEESDGETGKVIRQIVQVGEIRIRLVEYSPNYKADHWCSKGHIIHCLEGEMNTELEDGRIMKLSTGMTYIVGDNCEAHRSSTINGCKLFIVD